MRTVNIYDAKTHFSQLINQLISSEKEIIISKAGKPVARLVPYQTPMHERKPGYWRNKIRISPDFDELPDTVRDAFKGKKHSITPKRQGNCRSIMTIRSIEF